MSRDEKHLSLGIWCALYYTFDGSSILLIEDLSYSQKHGCWYPGDTDNQTSATINEIFPEDVLCDTTNPSNLPTYPSRWSHMSFFWQISCSLSIWSTWPTIGEPGQMDKEIQINSLAPRRSAWNFRYIHVIFELSLVIDSWGLPCEITLLHFIDEKSTLVQVMAWCHQASSQ